MSNLKKITALVLALALVMTMFAGAAIKTDLSQFTDADQFTEAQQGAIALLYPVGVISGVSETMLGSANLTRAQLCTVMYVLINGSTTGAAAWASQVFDDVAATSWAAGYVNWAYTKGLIYGYGDNKFGPDDAVTPTQAAAMLARMFDAKACANPDTFAQDAQAAAVKYDLINGVETANFFGQKLISRGDMFLMIANALVADVNGKTIIEDVFDLGMIEGAILLGAEKQYYKDGQNTANAYSVFAFRTETAGDVSYFATDLLCVEDDATIDDIGCKYLIIVGKTPTYNGFYKLYAAYEMTGDNYYSVVEGTVNDGKLVLTGKTQNVFFDKDAKIYVNGEEVKADAMTTFAKYYGVNNVASYKLIDNDGDGYYEYAFINYLALAEIKGEWVTGNVTYYSSTKTYSINGTAYKWGQYWDKAAGKFVDNSQKCYDLLGQKYVAISDVQYDFYVADGYIYDVRMSESTQFAGNYGVVVRWNGANNVYKNMYYFTFINEKNEFVNAYVEKINEATGTQDGYYVKANGLVYFTDWNEAGDVCSLYTADYAMSNYTFNDFDTIANAGAVTGTLPLTWDVATTPDLSKLDAYYCLLPEASITMANVKEIKAGYDSDQATTTTGAETAATNKILATAFVKTGSFKTATAFSASNVYGIQAKYTTISLVPDLSNYKKVVVTDSSNEYYTDANGGILVFKTPADVNNHKNWSVVEAATDIDVGNSYAIATPDTTADIILIKNSDCNSQDEYLTLKNIWGDMLKVGTAYEAIPAADVDADYYVGGTDPLYAVSFNSLLNSGAAFTDAIAAYEAFKTNPFITIGTKVNATVSVDYGNLDADQIQIYRANGYWSYRAYADLENAGTAPYNVNITINGVTYKIVKDTVWKLAVDGKDPGYIVGDSSTDVGAALTTIIAALNGQSTVYTDAALDALIESIKGNSLYGNYTTTGQKLLNTNYGVVFAYGRLSNSVSTYTWKAYNANEFDKDFGCGLFNDDTNLVKGSVETDNAMYLSINTNNSGKTQRVAIYGNAPKNYYFEGNVTGNLVNFATGDELIYAPLNGVNYVKAMKVTVAGPTYTWVTLDAENTGALVTFDATLYDAKHDTGAKYSDYVPSNTTTDNTYSTTATPFPYGDDVLSSGWIVNEDAEVLVYFGLTGNYSNKWEVKVMDVNGNVSTKWCTVGVGGLGNGDLILAYTDDEGTITDIIKLATFGDTAEDFITFVEGNTYFKNVVNYMGSGKITSEGFIEGTDNAGIYGNYFTNYYNTDANVIYIYADASGVDTVTTTFDAKWIGKTCSFYETDNYTVVRINL